MRGIFAGRISRRNSCAWKNHGRKTGARRKYPRAGNPRRSRLVGRRRKFEGRGGLAMEAAPHRHNITILERPPGARGGRHHGREAGLVRSPHAAISPGDDGVGFLRPRRGVQRRRDAGRLRAAPAPLWLPRCLPFPLLTLFLFRSLCLPRESSLLCLSF